MIQETEVVQKFHTGNTHEMVGRKTQIFTRACKESIDLTTIEPLRPDEKYGKILGRKCKLLSSQLMIRRNVPLRL